MIYSGNFRNQGTPARGSTSMTRSPIATVSPSTRAVTRPSPSSETMITWYGASFANLSGAALTIVSV